MFKAKRLSYQQMVYVSEQSTWFILVYLSLIVKQAIFAWVNQAQIDSWIQPVLSNEGLNFLLKETTGAFEGALTQS